MITIPEYREKFSLSEDPEISAQAR
jgi:hypothetical protein